MGDEDNPPVGKKNLEHLSSLQMQKQIEGILRAFMSQTPNDHAQWKFQYDHEAAKVRKMDV